MTRLAVLLALLLALLPPAAATAAPSGPAEYRGAVREAAALVQRARAVQGVEQELLARQARDALRGAAPIRLADGTTLEPDNRDILDALAGSPPDLERAAADLAALDAALARRPANTVPAAQARAGLRAILDRPEFRPRTASYGVLDPILGPIVGIANALIEFANQQLDRVVQVLLDVLAGKVSPLNLAILLGSVAALAAAIVFILGRVGGVMAPEIGAAGRRAAHAHLSAAAAWAEAGTRAAAGDYRGAVRLAYLSALLALDEADRLRYRPALTNREHLVQAPPAILPALEPLVARYDRLWYGQSTCDEPEYRAFRALAERVRAAAA